MIPFSARSMLASLLLTGYLSSAQQSDTVSFARGQLFSSPFGKRTTVKLPDQSEVMLNSNTTLWLDRNFGRSRTVEISGDAFFSIKKSVKPFVIRTPHLLLTVADKASMRVNGFATMAGEETLLFSGQAKAVKSYYSELDHEPYFLTGGEMVMMNKDIDLMEKETFDVAGQKAWWNNRMEFKNASLSEVVNTLKGWFNLEIAVFGRVPQDLTYTGTFMRSDLQQILASLGREWHFRYEAYGNDVRLKF